jgi:hypothetical protein
VAVLEHKGILTQQEVLDEITRLKATTPTARELIIMCGRTVR